MINKRLFERKHSRTRVKKEGNFGEEQGGSEKRDIETIELLQFVIVSE